MYSFGIDIGGTNIAVGIVNSNCEIIAKISTPTIKERNYKEILKDAAELCNKLLEQTSLNINEFRGIGIGTPGIVDCAQGMFIYASTFNYKNVSFRDEMKKYFDLPLMLENDANCAALAENRAGAAKGANTSVTITLGTGIGGGVIIDKKIFNGSNNAGTELGHMVIEVDGVQCACGRKGCWEKYASASGIKMLTQKAVDEDPDGGINRIVMENGGVISGKTVFEAARKGDARGLAVVDTYCTYLAAGITNLINIFQPDVLTIGGGVSNEGDYLLDMIKEKVAREVYTKGAPVKQTELRLAVLGNDAGIIGAAMLCGE